FIFTPRGEVRELPAGATVLDFAYRIHTRVGDTATGARVQTSSRDGTLVARDVGVEYQLQTGDVIAVRTDARSRPQPEWLHIAVTRYAKEKIGRALRQQRRQRWGRDASPRLEPSSEPAAESDSDLPQPALRHPSGKPATIRLALCCFPCPGDDVRGVADT